MRQNFTICSFMETLRDVEIGNKTSESLISFLEVKSLSISMFLYHDFPKESSISCFGTFYVESDLLMKLHIYNYTKFIVKEMHSRDKNIFLVATRSQKYNIKLTPITPRSRVGTQVKRSNLTISVLSVKLNFTNSWQEYNSTN